VVPENRAGGNGVVAGVAVQTSAPDGYTLLFGASIHVLAGAILRNPPYDPIADFTPVARVAQGPLLLVASPRLPQTSLAELIAAIRAQPRQARMWRRRIRAAWHLAILGFARAVGSEVPIVSYRGSAAALTDLTAGTVQVMADPILSALPLARGGQIRALAITAPQRSPAAPDIPTVAEAGLPGLEFASWYALWGPRGLPAPIVGRLNAVLQEALQQPAPSRRLADLGFEPVAESPADFARFQSADAERGAGLLRTSGFEPQ
jgi:tripartite-type tricarboxylate transporter receptor subunit TctC